MGRAPSITAMGRPPVLAVARAKLRSNQYTRHMNLREVADMLGYRGPDRVRTMRRQLLALERRTGRRFLVRVGTDTRVRYLVTLSVLRRECPHFFDARDEAKEAVRVYLESTDDRLKALERRMDAGEDRLATLVTGLSKELKQMRAKMDALGRSRQRPITAR